MDKDKVKLEFVAKITLPDGKVIECKVDADDGIPAPDDFDTSSKNGFLESFDVLEKVTLEARNKIASDITEAYLEELSKKTNNGHCQSKSYHRIRNWEDTFTGFRGCGINT
jgi:hypothetical protein